MGVAAAAESILVLGAGPAGCVLAARLARLGHAVTLVGAARAPAWEGMSPRVRDALERAGCLHAAAVTGTAARRLAHWNGLTSEHNEEFVVARAALDAALRRDAAAAGAVVVEAAVARVGRDAAGWVARDASGRPAGAGRFLVEARGRRAPAAGRTIAAGPATVAVARTFRGDPPSRAQSAAASFADGWAWLAAFPDGTRIVQFLQAAGGVPARAALTRRHASLTQTVPEALAWVDGAVPVGPATARDATSALRGGLVDADRLRIGDAAVTIDPLSGNGVFEALRGAFAAVAVVETLLADADALPLVRRFVEGQAAALFDHAARIGRDFHRAERRWSERPFWQARAGWPTEAEPEAAAPAIRARPVVADGRIVERDVFVTPAHPRGVLSIAGVELAPLLRRAAAGALAGDADPATRTALAWLAANRFHPHPDPTACNGDTA